MEQKKILSRCPRFSGLTEAEMGAVLREMQVKEKDYEKGEILLFAGEVPRDFGIVLEGGIVILKEEFSGSTTLLSQGFPGEIFAEAFAASGEPSLVTVEAAKKTRILWISYGRMMRPEGGGRGKGRLVENMMHILAEKNLFLANRVSHLSRRTLREKVLSYLGEQAAKQGSREFDIPFDRQKLADYLAADRSALSAVLGKLQREGVLTFRKHHFILHTEDEVVHEMEKGDHR